jgi:release factor glutamine methyltransferase
MSGGAERLGTTQLKVLVEDATVRLRAAGVETPTLDAELLMASAAGVTRARLHAATIAVDRALRERYGALIEKRAARMPLAYIVGRREFYSLEFEVTLEVLIPRPETESVVEAALIYLEQHPAARAIDLGTGSGAIAIALAANAPRTEIVATDVAAEALALAARNAARNRVAARVEFRRADCWTVSDGGAPLGRFDLIVANPPYIRTSELAALAPEVRDFEPRLALDGGADGLDFYRRIAAGAGQHLKPGGALMVEVGQGQAGDVAAIFRAADLGEISVVNDLAGIERVVRVFSMLDARVDRRSD